MGCKGNCGGGVLCDTSDKAIKGYINIYDVGGLYQAMSAIYDTEKRAEETGKLVKGYIGTTFINLTLKGKVNGNE